MTKVKRCISCRRLVHLAEDKCFCGGIEFEEVILADTNDKVKLDNTNSLHYTGKIIP